jgi:hypothetical protein
MTAQRDEFISMSKASIPTRPHGVISGRRLIDLKALAESHRYRTTVPPRGDFIDLDEQERFRKIPCKNDNFIMAHSDTELSAYASGAREGIPARLAALPGARVLAESDFEAQVAFKPDRLDAVADLLQARRKPRYTP